MMPKAALALLLCVASSDAWFLYKAPGGVEFNASGHRSQYLALASRTVGVKGRVVAGLSDASRYFSVLAGGGKSDRRNAKPVVLARGRGVGERLRHAPIFGCARPDLCDQAVQARRTHVGGARVGCGAELAIKLAIKLAVGGCKSGL